MNGSVPEFAERPDLRGWSVIALRTADQNAALRRTVVATGAGFIGLPALRLGPAAEPDRAGRELAAALHCQQCIFTSPAAVRFAARLRPLRDYQGLALAVGRGTARALARAGVGRIEEPDAGMHSEGLLALPALNPPAPQVGLVTAPGGRGVIAESLASRGVMLQVAHVYRRSAGRIEPRHVAALLAAGPRLALLLSSAEALSHTLAQLPADAIGRLSDALVVASSERLLDVAGRSGLRRRLLAASPRPLDLLAAIGRHAKAGAFR
jgi:uroporphyrinogen-III synthase